MGSPRDPKVEATVAPDFMYGFKNAINENKNHTGLETVQAVDRVVDYHLWINAAPTPQKRLIATIMKPWLKRLINL